jgi:hypothetical protein
VDSAEEPQGYFPARLVVAADLLEDGVLRVLAREASVERRAALLEVARKAAKDVRERFRAQTPSAALARSATFWNAAGSFTARSASTLRSSSISAFLRPATNWL